MITPARRSSAEAIHLMLTHALGEAGSPFLVGFLIDAMEKKVIKSSSILQMSQMLMCPSCVRFGNLTARTARR